MTKAAETFNRIYGREPEMNLFTPYRVCPIGAHVDHQLGVITGFAIDKGIHLACIPSDDGIVEVSSLQFEGRVRFDLKQIPDRKQNDWADYLRGAAAALSRIHPLKIGLRGVFNGELPIGGLSSSAAVVITFLNGLCKINGIPLTEEEMICTAVAAENNYVGVSSGKLDQSCEIYCRKDHLLYMDMADGSYERIPMDPQMKPCRIAVLFSGIERTLAGSRYNTRVDECRGAAYALKAYAGMDYGKIAQTNLREVPEEVFLRYRDRLPEPWVKRLNHYYSECNRVRKGVDAWRRGDMDAFGELIFESGLSSIEQWEAGSPELKSLYRIMRKTDGIYGGRFSGAGFRGCCMAVVDPAYEESIRETVSREYLREFPELEGKFGICFCDTADGVIL